MAARGACVAAGDPGDRYSKRPVSRYLLNARPCPWFSPELPKALSVGGLPCVERRLGIGLRESRAAVARQVLVMLATRRKLLLQRQSE